MNTKVNEQQPDQVIIPPANSAMADFDFDRWARDVRRQMIASLRKRGDNL
jgi:hypothetical protein